MRDGNWEVSLKMAGMEASALKQTQCVTPAMLKDGQGGLPQGLGNDCKVLDYKLAGNTATYKVSCEQPAQMTHASTANAPFAVPPSLVRLSAGIESADDLVADLEHALATIVASPS